MIRVYPVAAPTALTNSFGEGRSGHSHQGVDIFGAIGDPLVAVDDGELRSGVDPLGGNIVNLYATDGARYYYAHLNDFANADGSPHAAFGSLPPAPRRVRAGDVVGFLGKTGNAATTQPHLHFEAHPRNGPAVDPFPSLERAPRLEPNQRPAAAQGDAGGILRTALGLGLLAGVGWALLYPDDARALGRRLRLSLP